MLGFRCVSDTDLFISDIRKRNKFQLSSGQQGPTRGEGGLRPPSLNGPTSLGGEGESEQARAEQHETGGSQGQEAVGNQVMMAHCDILLFRRSSELIKTFGTDLLKRVMQVARKRRHGSRPR